MNILIVDDDPDSLRLLAMNLRHAGHTPMLAESGQHALALFERERARLVITDWMMPGLAGPELIRRLRALPHPGYIYIIMLTALGDKPHLLTGLESGADDYLTKPYDSDELLARVAIAERILRLEDRLLDSNRQMEQLAMLDPLTGLLNRRAVTERLEAELSRLRRGGAELHAALSLVLLDLDHFKQINDTHGHAVGDEALRQVAHVLIQNLRPYDAAGRWGGEEFLVALPGTGLAEAAQAAERLRQRIHATHLSLSASQAAGPARQGRLPLSASLGVTSVTAAEAQSTLLDELVRRADAALYSAKARGRNSVAAR